MGKIKCATSTKKYPSKSGLNTVPFQAKLKPKKCVITEELKRLKLQFLKRHKNIQKM
jgi:hypothetical protein